MSDLISRSALLEEFEWLKMTVGSGSVGDIKDAIERIKKAPAVDAVEVVRCDECIFAQNLRSAYVDCKRWRASVPRNGFCFNGAKMTEKKARDLKPCDSCEHYEWDMPQCKGCNPENGFKWYKAEVSEAVDAMPKWISVEDILPTECEDVLVFSDRGVGLGYYDVYHDNWEDYTNADCGPITHWMPLPEPPKEDT